MVDSAIYQQYLQHLKSTVEGLLVTQVANVWSIYGGLNRLYLCLEKIFRHGCRNDSQEGNFYNFIQGLEWLQPETSKPHFALDCEYRPHVPILLKDDKSCIWLYRSLESHSLSAKLSWLLLDNSHVLNCYQPWAFLCQKEYADAVLICLRAVEKNQATYLSEINPRLFLKNANSKEFVKAHRRSLSFPDKHLKFCGNKSKNNALQGIPDSSTTSSSSRIENKQMFGKLKPWSSLPVLQIDSCNKINRRVHFESKTTPNTPIHTKKISPSLLKVDYNALQSKVPRASLKKSMMRPKDTHKDIKRVVINNSNIIEYTPQLNTGYSDQIYQGEGISTASTSSTSYEKTGEKHKSFLSQSPLSMVEYTFLPMQGEKDYSRNRPKSFIEDGGMSILPMSTGYFPKPTKGQSLTSFLTSSKLARSNAELDRENAHFSISEAIISAMEKLKCQYRDLGLHSDVRLMDSDDSLDRDPEIENLKQRIRLRRGQKILESRRKQWAANLLSDGKTDTTTTASPNSTPADTSSDTTSSEEVEDFEIDQASNLKENQGLSMSMASLYSEADIMKKPRGAPDGASEILTSGTSDVLSAEGVALSLISKFNEKHLPKASDLDWLVSEEDAPQALLPLPKSWPVSPDDCEGPTTPLRGTRDWAPPRAQIVLTLHPQPSRKEIMEKQNYRCAGCGMKVAAKYASKFRYCDYLGKYFCTGCHKNQVALIPARVLYKWDFNRYPVSTFSYKLLEQMYADPLFRIFELNKNITKLCKHLEFIRRYRLGLCYLKEYVSTCRFGEMANERLEQDLPPYFLVIPEEYSLDDLVKIKSGEMKTKLRFLVDICCRHTTECKLCLARGYICEICNSDEVIFPWQMRIVSRCSTCRTCFHLKCWNPNAGKNCTKCERKIRRKESLTSASSQ